MLRIQNIGYDHPDRERLFGGVSMAVSPGEHVSIVGNNGVGKSTFLRILAGELVPTSGTVHIESHPYFIPQHVGQYDELTVEQAMRVGHKLQALRSILAGSVTADLLDAVGDDWDIEERCVDALKSWGLVQLDLRQSLSTLSGGEKSRVFLAGIIVHLPECVLLDEPTNHLDRSGREILYDFVRQFEGTLLVVSHDRALLNLVQTTYELSANGITSFGGNYEFYRNEKNRQISAVLDAVAAKEKFLRKAEETARESHERQLKRNAKGKKQQLKSGTPKIMMNAMRNKAESSTAKMDDIHANKLASLQAELSNIKLRIPNAGMMKIELLRSAATKQRLLFSASGIQVTYGSHHVWENPIDFHLRGKDRIAIHGRNGSGKTTLLNVVMGNVVPTLGEMYRTNAPAVLIDQEYSLIDNKATVYDQVKTFAAVGVADHEIGTCLDRFLFPKGVWDKSCSALSGGERMRLMLCCITLIYQSPELIILDEPTNNLDLKNIEILAGAVRNYRGALLVVSHDDAFLNEIGIESIYEIK